jgi:predicted small lipoprotein YifL
MNLTILKGDNGMKKNLAWLILFAMIVLPFTGCGGKVADNGTGTDKEAAATDNSITSTDNASDAAEAPAAEDTGPYNYAAGKYDVDDRGIPTAKYEYECRFPPPTKYLLTGLLLFSPIRLMRQISRICRIQKDFVTKRR